MEGHERGMNITSDAAVAGCLSCLIGLNFFSAQTSSSLSTGGCVCIISQNIGHPQSSFIWRPARFIWHQLKVVHIPNTNTNTDTNANTNTRHCLKVQHPPTHVRSLFRCASISSPHIGESVGKYLCSHNSIWRHTGLFTIYWPDMW